MVAVCGDLSWQSTAQVMPTEAGNECSLPGQSDQSACYTVGIAVAMNEEVRAYVESGTQAGEFYGRLLPILAFLVPASVPEGKSHLTIELSDEA